MKFQQAQSSHLRHFDIDDLYILATLVESRPKLCTLAKSLGLTPPALSHRLRKIKTYTGFNLTFSQKYQKYEISEEGIKLGLKAQKALSILLQQ